MRPRYSLILLTIILFTACQEDKECVPPPLEKHIVNTWDAKLASEKDKPQKLTFESGGNLKESKGLIFGASSSPVCSWEIDDNSVILSGKFSNGSIERYECAVISRNCNQIILDIEGFDQIELNKK